MNKNVTLNAICVFGNELLICSYAIGQGAVPTQDIVLIKLESPFTLNKHVKPACLPTKVYANWKFSCILLNFCTSESSKNQPPLKLKKQMFKLSKVQRSRREFSHGLHLRLIPLILYAMHRVGEPNIVQTLY